MTTDALFKDRRLNVKRLLDYGFVPEGDGFVRAVRLLDGQFDMTMRVSADGRVDAKVVDGASGEEYVLHRVPGSGGAFVGKIKEEYEAVLGDVAAKCFELDVFKSEYAKLLIAHVREKYGRDPEYLWERFPRNAVWRRSDNSKWFGALLTIPRNKLGVAGDETVEIIDLRIDKDKLPSVVDGKKYFPGYHMNKNHWFTICLDGSVPIEEIYDWLAKSYEIAKKR